MHDLPQLIPLLTRAQYHVLEWKKKTIEKLEEVLKVPSAIWQNDFGFWQKLKIWFRSSNELRWEWKWFYQSCLMSDIKNLSLSWLIWLHLFVASLVFDTYTSVVNQHHCSLLMLSVICCNFEKIVIYSQI